MRKLQYTDLGNCGHMIIYSLGKTSINLPGLKANCIQGVANGMVRERNLQCMADLNCF